MINENRIIFGSGDVLANCMCYGLRFIDSSESYKIGTCITSEIKKDGNDEISVADIRITNFDDLNELKKLLESVKISDTNIFEYDNHIFDFSNFNVKSVDVVLDQLDTLSHSYMWLLPLCV